MDHEIEHIEFAMYLDDLSHVPQLSLPEEYELRTFCAGDEDAWVNIEMLAGEFSSPERGHSAFDRDFRPAYERLPGRMFFLVHGQDGPVGTATAWEGEHNGRLMGQLHWVAIVPAHQGKGLAKPMVAAVLTGLAQDYDEAFLTTQTSSWRAVAMYRQFGFAPVVDGPDIERALALIEARMVEIGR